MKKIFPLLFLLFTISKSFAQAPAQINYQGIARNAAGQALISQAIGIKFIILQGSASGTNVFSEQQSTTTSNLGLFNVQIGSVNTSLNTLNWQNGPYFLEVLIDAAGGTSYTSIGTQQLLSVPYALYAGSAPAPTVSFTNNILNVGGNTTSITAGTSYTSGNGITISNGTITNAAPNQTVNIAQNGVAQVTNAYPNFTVNVPAPTLAYNATTSVLSINQGTTTNSATLTGTGSSTINITGTGNASVNPTSGSAFTVNVPIQTFTPVFGTGTISSSLGGSFVITPTIIGTGLANVTPAPSSANAFTVNVPTPVLTSGANTIALSQGSVVSTTSIPPLLGNVTGNINSNVVTAIQNVAVSSTSPSPGQYLGYNGSSWVPTTPSAIPSQIFSGSGTNTITSTLGGSFVIPTGVTPTLSLNSGTLSIGPGGNSININTITPWVQTGSTVALVTPSNYVGIGTNNPNTHLQISGNSSSSNPTLQYDSPETSLLLHNDYAVGTGDYSSIAFSSRNNVSNIYEAAKIAAINTDHNATNLKGDLAFLTRESIGLTEKMRIAGNGKIGIGTLLPTNQLDVLATGTNGVIKATTTGSGAGITVTTTAGNGINVTSASGYGINVITSALPAIVANSGTATGIEVYSGSSNFAIWASNTNTGAVFGNALYASNNNNSPTIRSENSGSGACITASANVGSVLLATNNSNVSPTIKITNNNATSGAVGLEINSASSGTNNAIGLQINNGHIKTSGAIPSPASISKTSNISGILLSTGFISGTDITGVVSIVVNNTSAVTVSAGDYIEIKIKFNKQYSTTSPNVFLTPTNEMLGMNYRLSNTTSSDFTISIYKSSNGGGPASIPAGATFILQYFVIE
jgi:trimeric autotransporter adhesin